MDEENMEIPTYMLLDKCKCCLGDGQLKNMWLEYSENGKQEIYGEMLKDCFDLSHSNQYNIETQMFNEQICESCIGRLRDAVDFKQEVLACAQLWDEQLNKGFDFIKAEVECVKEECIDLDNQHENDTDWRCNQDFEDVEYLELDDGDIIETTVDLEPQEGNQKRTTSDTTVPPPSVGSKRKWPKKRRKGERLKIYKQYIRDDMVKAMSAVQSGALNTAEAAKRYNVPRKTLSTKLLLAEQGKDIGDNENLKRMKKTEKHYQFIGEVKKILTYTNAVPFKTVASRYFCTYCSTDGPRFEDPDELRAHTRTAHVDDKTRNIEMVLRPQFQNEVLKMDIDALHCTVCCTIIPTWAYMFEHLEESHGVELDEAYTKVIPYVLTRDLKCALCNDSFPNYHHLDSHMNTHYDNYICPECGDTFLSASRLNKHVKVHSTGRYPCEACGKVFHQIRYMQKHYDHVHKQEHNIKCLYCPEKFYGTFQRHLHMVERHEEKVRVTTCEMCGMRFEWRRYYVAHMRRKHNIRTT